MRKSILFFFIITLASNSQFLQAQSKIDVINYHFFIGLSDANDTLDGTAVIRFVSQSPKGFAKNDTITFDLASIERSGKGMIIQHISYGRQDEFQPWYQHVHDKIWIAMARNFSKKDTIVMTIQYHGIPSDGLIISKNKYGDRTFFADNWPNRAHNWIPCVDEPADKASFSFTVKAPPEYQVISNGRLDDFNQQSTWTSTTWVEDVPLPTKVMVIGVARFAIKKYESSPANIPVTAWVYPQDSTRGFINYSPAPGILSFFSNYVGPYPYNKLANVQSKTIFGGMENASAIFYEENSGSTNRSVEDLLAHEIAHQWFGDMASEKTFAHLWLSEGFATYGCDLYYENIYGVDSMRTRLESERRTAVAFAKKTTHPVVDTTSSLMDLLNPNSYQKGAWVLHMLRDELGENNFHRFIRAYYEKYKGRNANTDDLRAVAEEISHKDLRPFFTQWLYTPGVPQIIVYWNYDPIKKLVLLTVKQQQKQGAFQFPLRIALKGASSKTVTLHITKISEKFSFPVKEKIDLIQLDPDMRLLYDGHAEKEK
jgi:aminopeptidase N